MSGTIDGARRTAGALLLCALVASGTTRADDSLLDAPVIVTASRVPESADSTFFSTTVITREDIEARQVSSLEELLQELAGAAVYNSGGPGKVSGVFLRGTNSDHTLLLIDGQRVASSTSGTAPLELIPLSQVDHVEIVRGPRSTLYGSDAMGGVIQVFTRSPSEPGLSGEASAMTGTYDTHDFTGSIAGRGHAGWVRLGADVLTSGGISTCLPGAATAGAGCFIDRPDPRPDGYQNRSGNLTAGVRFSDRLSAETSWLYARGWTAYDGDSYAGNNIHFDELVGSVRLDMKAGTGWNVQVRGGRDRDRQDTFFNQGFLSRFNTTRDDASVQVDGKLREGLQLISGADYEHERIDTDAGNPFVRTARSTHGVFAELHAQSGAWGALAGGRLEDNSQFGHQGTENLALSRQFGPQLRAVFSWGTAFHAPTFNDLYYPGFGNAALLPELSRSFEAGLEGAAGSWRWSAHAYQTSIDRLIALVEVAAFTYTPENIAAARIRGVELQAQWRNADWRIAGQLTGMDPRNLGAGPRHGNMLPRRAKSGASLELRRTFTAAGSHGSVAVTGTWSGRRFEDLANTLPMGGYVTVDLLGEWTFGRVTVGAIAANVAARRYTTAAYLAQPGRHYDVTLRYRVGS